MCNRSGAKLKIGCCTTEIALTRCADFLISPSTTQFSVQSANLYCYSNSPRDMGNCRSNEEFFEPSAIS